MLDKHQFSARTLARSSSPFSSLGHREVTSGVSAIAARIPARAQQRRSRRKVSNHGFAALRGKRPHRATPDRAGHNEVPLGLDSAESSPQAKQTRGLERPAGRGWRAAARPDHEAHWGRRSHANGRGSFQARRRPGSAAQASPVKVLALELLLQTGSATCQDASMSRSSS